MKVWINVYLHSLMDAFPQERLSELIIRLRGQRSQRNFAKTLNVSYATIRSWEECESLPGLSSLEKLANYTNQSIEELLDYLKGAEDKSKPNNQVEARVAEDLLPQIENLSSKEIKRLTELMILKEDLSEEETFQFAKMLIKNRFLSPKQIGKLTQILASKLVNEI